MWPKFKLSDTEILEKLGELEASRRPKDVTIALLFANLFYQPRIITIEKFKKPEIQKVQNLAVKSTTKPRWPMRPRKGRKKHEESPIDSSR